MNFLISLRMPKPVYKDNNLNNVVLLNIELLKK